MAPSVREPKVKVIRTASILLVGSVLVTVPVFTAVAVEAVHAGQISPTRALLAAVAERYGGPEMKLAVVLTGAALLLLAAKLAFIGCYNVFQAIGEHGYLPAAIARAQSPGQPPRGAVVVITLGAFLLVLGAARPAADPGPAVRLRPAGLVHHHLDQPGRTCAGARSAGG